MSFNEKLAWENLKAVIIELHNQRATAIVNLDEVCTEFGIEQIESP